MKKINIVTGGGWILERIAEEVAKQCEKEFDVDLTRNKRVNADLRYYVNYDLVRVLGKGDGVNVGYFTHIDPNYVDRWQYAENALDYSVYIADKYKPSIPGKKIYPFGNKSNKKLKIGICGRMYEDGRKGQDRLVRLDNLLDNVTFSFLGSGWDTVKLKNETSYEQWESDGLAKQWYRSLNVFLSLAYLEGGSIPHLEAVKYGVPCRISFDVGNIEEWGSFYTIVNSVENIANHVLRLQYLNNGWEYFGQQHLDYFKELLK